MPLAVKILVATMTGTAELVAEEVEAVLAGKGFQVETMTMDGLGAEVFADDGAVYLICSSTYGQGDVPDNGQPLVDSLRRERPDLSGIRYGVIALGDMTYAQTFCGGGMTFAALLGELGATRIGEIFRHNATAGTLPEDEAVGWAEDWAEVLQELAPA